MAGKEGSMSCPEDTTPHQLLPEPAAGWVQAALATDVKCQPFGIGVGHQGPAGKVSSQLAKALLSVPHPQDPPSHALPHCCF